MGLFSSKKKTYVNTTVQRVFADTDIPDSPKTGVFKAIVANGDIVEHMLEQVVNSLGVKANNAFNWAKNHDYIYGVPTSTVKSTVNAKSIVTNVLRTLAGGDITLDYYVFGPMNSLHYGWQYLVNTYGYNPQTNELVALSVSTGFKCYLSNMVATYPKKEFEESISLNDTGVYAQYGPSPQSGYTPSNPITTLGSIGQYVAQPLYEVSETAADDYITASYEFMDATGAIIKRGLTINMTGLNLDDDYHQARYITASGAIKFFSYKEGSGTYPGIDGAFATDYDDLGTFYPWAYFRVLGNDMTSRTDRYYTDVQHILKMMNVDYETIAASINADSNVDDVEQAILMFAVNPANTDQESLEYMFEYVSVLNEASLTPGEIAGTLDAELETYSSSPANVNFIKDKFFTQAFQHNGTTKRRRHGKVAKVGEFVFAKGSDGEDIKYVDARSGVVGTRKVSQPYYSYSKQVLDNFYEEVRIYSPVLTYGITSKKGYVAGYDSKELIVPLDRAIVQNMGVLKRERLLARSLHMVINTKVVVKSPWYSSGAFKIIMIIVAVAIAVVSFGGLSGVSAALASLATMSAVVIIENIVIAIAINIAIKMFIKVVGPEIGLIAAIAAIAAGGYMALSTPASAGVGATATTATGTATTATQSLWGERLLQIGNNLSSATSSAFEEKVIDIQKEMTEFNEWATGQWNTLAEKKEQLGLTAKNYGFTGLEFVYTEPMLVMGESPDDFYTRTVHSGNIGAVSFQAVSNYASTALTLPTLTASLPDFSNGEPV